jgi:hypothetical protein
MSGAPTDVQVVSSGTTTIHTLPSSNAAGTTDTVALPVQGVSGGVPQPVSAVSGAFGDGSIATIGTQADTAWSGSGSSSLIAALKAIYNKLAGTLTASISGSVAVTGTFWQATQPISAASLPLPSGAATAANQITGTQYGNQANWVSGSASATSTTQTTVIAAPGSNKLYITGLQIGRTDAGTTAISVLLNDTASTEVIVPNSGGGGGNNMVFNPPLVLAATSALKFTASAGVTTIYVNAQGYNAA